MIGVKVYEENFEVMFEDIGKFNRVLVFRYGERIGHKDLPLLADTGRGVVEYCVKRVLHDLGPKLTDRILSQKPPQA